MPDQQPADTGSRLERWLDIDQPAPDLRAELQAHTAEMLDSYAADAARYQQMPHDDMVAALRDSADQAAESLADTPAPEQARDEVDVFKSALADTVQDFRDGRIGVEQYANTLVSAFAPFDGAEDGLNDHIDALQERIDSARAQLAELRDDAQARGEAEASPEDVARVFDYVQSGLEVVEAQIDTREHIDGVLHDSVEAMIDARADLPTADDDRIEAQRAALDRAHDLSERDFDAVRDDYAAMHEKIDVLADHVRDGDIPLNAMPEQVHAVVEAEIREIDAAHQHATEDAE